MQELYSLPGLTEFPPSLHMEMLRRYTSAFQRALPERSPDEVHAAMFFMICTIANALVDNKTLSLLGARVKSIHEAPEDMGEMLVRFVSAGVRELGSASPAARTCRKAGRSG